MGNISVDSGDDAVRQVEQLGITITIPKAAVGDVGCYAAGTDREGNELAVFETKVH
jgi:predicted enzyme related to lactoylglutathione lyase